jgi:hypothetical protein
MPSKPKTHRRETTPEERAIVWAHYLDGLSYSEIKGMTGHPKLTIQTIVDNLKARSGQDRFKSKPRPGVSRKVDSRGEKALLRHANKNTKDPLAVLGTPSKSGKQLDRGTVRKILKRYRKARRQAQKKPYLSKLHKKLWFQRCKALKANETVDDMNICWSDEATFEIRHDGRIVWVTRAPGEEFLEKNMKPSFKSGRSLVSVWASFCGRHLGLVVVLPKGQRMN